MTKHKNTLLYRITMKDNTEGDVASIRARLVQTTILASPLADQAGWSNIADITYNTHTALSQ